MKVFELMHELATYEAGADVWVSDGEHDPLEIQFIKQDVDAPILHIDSIKANEVLQ